MKKSLVQICIIAIIFVLATPKVYATTPYESQIMNIYKELEKAAEKDKMANKTVKTSKAIALTTIYSNYPLGYPLMGDSQLKDFIISCSIGNLDGKVNYLSKNVGSIRKINLNGFPSEEESKSDIYVVKYKIKTHFFTKNEIVINLDQLEKDPKLGISDDENNMYNKKTVSPGYVFTKTNDITAFVASLGGELILSKNIKILWFSDNKKQTYNTVVGSSDIISSFASNSTHPIKQIKFIVSYIYDNNNVIQEVIFTQIS